MNKSRFKALLAFGFIVSSAKADSVPEQLVAVKNAAYADGVSTATLAEQIRACTITNDGNLIAKDVLYQAAVMILNSAASNVVAKEAAQSIVAMGAGASFEEKAAAHAAKVNELNAVIIDAVNVNANLRPYAVATQSLLASESAASSWTTTIINKSRQWAAGLTGLWDQLTGAARDALAAAATAVDGHFGAVIRAVTGCALRTQELGTFEMARR